MRKKQTDRDMINEHITPIKQVLEDSNEIKWSKDILALLGKKSDAQIAKKLSVYKSIVRVKRLSLGIGSHHENKRNKLNTSEINPHNLS